MRKNNYYERKYVKGEYHERKIAEIRENAIAQIENSDGLAKLNDVRVAVLGKKGELTAVLKSMKEVAPEDRPKVGQWVNETRQEIENKLDEMKKKLEAAELEHRLENEVIDVTFRQRKTVWDTAIRIPWYLKR